MKIFRWFAAGVFVLLLAMLVCWRISWSGTSRTPRLTALPEGAPATETAMPAPAAPAPMQPAVAAPSPAKARPAVSDFESWVRTYVQADPAQRSQLLAKGEVFAAQRRAEMAE